MPPDTQVQFLWRCLEIVFLCTGPCSRRRTCIINETECIRGNPKYNKVDACWLFLANEMFSRLSLLSERDDDSHAVVILGKRRFVLQKDQLAD